MPLLKRETDCYPANLFHLHLDVHPWGVLHVRSRQEKSVARFLLDSGRSFYLPQVEKTIRRNGRTLRSYLPLFSSYVFFRGDNSVDKSLWGHDAIVRALAVEDQQRLDDELRQLWNIQRSGLSLVSHPFIALGDQVRITEGVFAGYRGVVVREKDAMLLVVSVSVISHSVAVELERDAVAPAPERVLSKAPHLSSESL
jgi:transcriptional antiterminator RfaH